MSYKNSRKNVLSANLVVMAITAVAVWQFYKFVSFKDPTGVLDAEGGIQHFWWAVGLGVLACAIAFLFFSVLLRYDSNNETHITSPPPRKKLSHFADE